MHKFATTDRMRGSPSRIVYQSGGLFEVHFDNRTCLLATTFPDQVVAAAYWRRDGRAVDVDFDPATGIIQRIGENLSNLPVPSRHP